MDEDEMDIDQQLLSRFSSMGTTDRDVLITQFQNLLGKQLDPVGCSFFLEMTNWNLQAAIGAYYDYEMPSMTTPSMRFICDVTIGEGESVPPNTTFLKTWRLQNSGEQCWPGGCCLRYLQGDKLGATDFVQVSNLMPKESGDVSVNMISPPNPGIYQGQWQMHTNYGVPFGEIIWVIVTVEVGGLLGVTQQLSRFATDLGQRQEDPSSLSPFGPIHNHEMEQESHDGGMRASNDIQMDDDSKSLTNNRRELKKLYNANANIITFNNKAPTSSRTDSPIVSSGTISNEFWSPIRENDRANLSTHSLGMLDSITEESVFESEQLNSTLPASLPSSSFNFRTEIDENYESPSKLHELERSFNSPDAPSPIKPQNSGTILRRDNDPIYDCNLRQL